jgi:hypothetical protein
MNSKNRDFQNKTNFGRKSLITLGMALFALSNANAETTLVKGLDANYATVAAVKAQQFENLLSDRNEETHGKFSPVEDKSVLNPEAVVGSTFGKSIEEVIAEDKKITESAIADEGYLFFKETATEEIIVQDNQIIDSNISTEVRPLYLEKTIEDTIAEDNAIIEATLPEQLTNLKFESIASSSVAEN